MFFWKIDEETIRCLINKQEIDNMGYDLKSLTTDNEQMEAFLEAIVENSQNYIEWRTENGIQNYVARSLPADQFLITISCTFQDVAIDRNLDQIQRMTTALNAKISRERLEHIYALSGKEKEEAFALLSKDLQDVCSGDVDEILKELEEGKKVSVSEGKEEKKHDLSQLSLKTGDENISVSQGKGTVSGTHKKKKPVFPASKMVFGKFSELVDFCSLLEKGNALISSLYKMQEEYVLLVDFSQCEDEAHAMSMMITAQEYGARCGEVRYEESYLSEHGKLMIENKAIEVLQSMI